MVSHKTLDVALHSHSASAVMLTVTVPPAAPTDVLVGCTPKVQPCDWLTDKVCPATTAVPIRDLPDVAQLSPRRGRPDPRCRRQRQPRHVARGSPRTSCGGGNRNWRARPGRAGGERGRIDRK